MSIIYRGMLEDFGRLSKLLGVDLKKCVSYSQLKKVLRSIDYELFNDINSFYFNALVHTDGRKWYSLDGKELRGTIDKCSGKVRGISIVNLTEHHSGYSKIVGQYDATKASEKPVVSNYFKDQDLTNKSYSFDGLHTSTANLETIQQKGVSIWHSSRIIAAADRQKKALSVCQDLEQSSEALCQDDQGVFTIPKPSMNRPKRITGFAIKCLMIRGLKN